MKVKYNKRKPFPLLRFWVLAILACIAMNVLFNIIIPAMCQGV